MSSMIPLALLKDPLGDVAQDLYGRPDAARRKAIAEGFRHLGLKEAREVLAREFIVYDALYAYSREEVKAGRI